MSGLKCILRIEDLGVRFNGQDILQGINLEINSGEQWAIVGLSGSGKTSLLKAIAGKLFHSGSISFPPGETPKILLVEQQHHFKNLSNTSSFYYQQRFNSMDADDSLTVEQYLLGDPIESNPTMMQITHDLHLDHLLNEPLIQLSNGENKRLQLAIALSQAPGMLLLDNPFTGLDKEGRQTLNEILVSIEKRGIPLLLVTGAQSLPASVTHVLELIDGRDAFAGKRNAFESVAAKNKRASTLDVDFLVEQQTSPDAAFKTAVLMRKVTITYGERTIIDNLSWQVLRGERWSITGANGAGKSTLLSLITGDNPQAYANEIWLFDRRRGTGESIWDIKKKIGFVSPELHVFFDSATSSFDVVGSGFFDTIGLFRLLSDEQETRVERILKAFDLLPLKDRPLFQLSLGQQRMILLARALVKSPAMLILDEPCQGLDEQQATAIRELVNTLCNNSSITLLYVSHYTHDIPSCVTQTLHLPSQH